MGEINDATSSFKILCVLQVKTTESHKDNQQTILSLILPLPLFSLFIPKCLFQFKCLAHIPLLCLSPNIIPRQVQLLSHNRVCLLVLVSGQPFSSLHHFLSFVNLFPLAYTVRFQRSLPLI